MSGTAGEKKGDYSGGPGRPADARRLRAGLSQQGHRGAATDHTGWLWRSFFVSDPTTRHPSSSCILRLDGTGTCDLGQ